MKKIAIEEHLGKDAVQGINKRIMEMDESGIDMQVLSETLLPNMKISIPEAEKWAEEKNNVIAGIIEKYPERFSGFAAISLLDPDSAARELERAVTRLGFKGALTGPEIEGYLDMPQYHCFLETAEKLDVPVYLHPKVPPDDMVQPYLAYPILSRSMWGFAAHNSLHAMRLIMSGIFEKYPRLKIILGHLGEGIPYFLWRIDRRWADEKDGRPGMFDGDMSAKILSKKPSEYFRDNFYVTTSGMFWQPALQMVFSALGADKMLFAVDYPAESSTEAVQAVDSMQISQEEKEKIFHLNAEKLLRL